MTEAKNDAAGSGLAFGEIPVELSLQGGFEVLQVPLGPFAVKKEIEFGKGHLAHRGISPEEIAGLDHFGKQIVGYVLPAFMMLGEQIEALSFPAPVLHNL